MPWPVMRSVQVSSFFRCCYKSFLRKGPFLWRMWRVAPHTGIAPRQLDRHWADRRLDTDRVRLPHRLSCRSEVESYFFRLQQYDCP